MSGAALYVVRIAGDTPVTAELVQAIGEPDVLHLRIGALVLILDPARAEDVADTVIECLAGQGDPVAYVPTWAPV